MKNPLANPALARILSGLLFICALAACATLPDVRNLGSSLTPKETPTVAGSRGVLPDAKAESILARRLRGSRIDAKELAALEEAATGSPLIAGNQVTLLFDGPQTMQAMIEAIGTAVDSINLETYIFDQDELGLRFADLLIERQRAGVQVNIIYDSVGSLSHADGIFRADARRRHTTGRIQSGQSVEAPCLVAPEQSGPPQDPGGRWKNRFYRRHQHYRRVFEQFVVSRARQGPECRDWLARYARPHRRPGRGIAAVAVSG